MSLCTSIAATRSCITLTRHLLKQLERKTGNTEGGPPDGTPHSNQETDTRARSSSGHDPQRGSQHQTWLRPRTVQSEPVTTDGTPDPACTFRPAPTYETTANHAQTPARPQFHPGHRATKWPIFSLVCHWLQDFLRNAGP